MDSKEHDFQQRLLSTFRVEAAEHVQAMSSGLFQLGAVTSAEQRRTVTETVFRAAHSLKGAARAVGEAEIESICHSAESALAGLKSGQLQLTPPLADVLHDAVAMIGRLLPSVGNASRDTNDGRTAQLLRRIATGVKGGAAAGERAEASRPPEAVTGAAAPGEQAEDGAPAMQRDERGPARPAFDDSGVLADSVRIATARLDTLLLETEELLSAKAAAALRAAELRALTGDLAARQKSHVMLATLSNALERALVKGDAHDAADQALVQSRKLVELTRAEVAAQKVFATKLQSLAKASEQDQRALGAGVDGLLEDMKQVLMLPISSVLEILPRVVRDLAREQRKEVELVVSGAEIQVDRRILQAIRDPLIHMVRNSVDHGIELPEARTLAGKQARATLTIAAARKDGKVEVVVSDDGRGIDAARLREAARKGGVAADAGESHDDEDVLPLVFRSGVSTSPIITDLSGRGLGLAIVQENVERLGGMITVESRPGAGTAFRMTLPVTLATFRGVHVRVNDQDFIVPTAQVERALRCTRDAIKTVQNRETLYWNEETVSLVRLADALEISTTATGVPTGAHVIAIILTSGGTRIAFLVDDILGEQEVLAKTLGKPLSRVRNVAGATVLGSGKPVVILNVADLLRSAVRVAAGAAPQVQSEQAERATKSILIAEDSITSRALLKNILESAGYQVAAVVDGAQAFTRLKSERFDLVVSDVEMPQMDGLELTARIRADKTLAELPVVLVTGLESREHRERGADAGANAYIVKSSFDHSNLLEVVGRLL